MPPINRIADYAEDLTAWRRHLHMHPELQFECHETAAFVVERLKKFGIEEIHEGIATSGVVAVIEGQGDGPTIGLRADMDALPMDEKTGLEYASNTPGKMHACGHDGHTVMLLGAARYLAETRNFKGRVALIFQPAEEGGGGGEVMVQEGIMERFDISSVYALHNTPGAREGVIYTTPGPIMAAADTFHVHIKGEGGHGAYPSETRDPVVACLAICNAFQTIVSRNRHGLEDLVVSVTQIHTGTIDNIIPETAYINGTIRTFDEALQKRVVSRMQEICAGIGQAYGVMAEFVFEKGYPPTINHAQETAFASKVAKEVVGDAMAIDDAPPEMGAEDFAYMLQARPGCYLFLGQGEGPGLHHPEYDFNDEIAPIGASFFARLVETAQPL
ncbi:MAG: M20 family metallopeptidase [Litoreibacter sp.]|nr:M20 family metallopeptidase [Litoreibacter sp.]